MPYIPSVCDEQMDNYKLVVGNINQRLAVSMAFHVYVCVCVRANTASQARRRTCVQIQLYQANSMESIGKVS